MPWSEATVKDQREEFTRLASQAGANVAELCRRYGISRKSGYKWIERVREGGAAALADRSRRPLSSPRLTPQDQQSRVLDVRARHPAWGARKIAHVLKRDAGLELAPSTVNSVLHRHGLIGAAAREAATRWQRFEHERPNALWQMDFKGHFAMERGGRCHPLTVLDDHSRFNLVLQALDTEREGPVRQALQQAFTRYGLPERINADNGPPWGTGGAQSLSALGVWLIRLGIRLSHSRPAHPQTNGKDERFHRTLKAELLAHRHWRDLAQAQHEFSAWRHQYNFKRPHQALDMHTPASRYASSPRAMPQHLAPIEYGPEDLVRRVQQGGLFSLHGRELRITTALAGQPIALRPRLDEDGIFDVFFCHQQIDVVDLNEPR